MEGSSPWRVHAERKMNNPSCLIYGPQDARFEDQPLPLIEDPSDVIVRIAYVGIERSDVRLWAHGGVGISETRPIILGHEASGVVHAIGSAVRNVRPGDPVAIESALSCRLCSRCRTGKYNLCPQVKLAGRPPIHGMLTKYYKTQAECCYEICPAIGKPFDLEEAALIEPLAMAVHAIRQAGLQPGDKALILGAGMMGCLCAAVAREYGANTVVLVDKSRTRLDFSHLFVANGRMSFSTAITSPSLLPEENAQCLRGMHCSHNMIDSDIAGFDVAIEATGDEASIQMAVHALRAGGTLVQMEAHERDVHFPMAVVAENEINIKGCFHCSSADFRLALDLALMRKVDLRSLISKVVPFTSAIKAIEANHVGEGFKILVQGPVFVD